MIVVTCRFNTYIPGRFRIPKKSKDLAEAFGKFRGNGPFIVQHATRTNTESGGLIDMYTVEAHAVCADADTARIFVHSWLRDLYTDTRVSGGTAMPAAEWAFEHFKDTVGRVSSFNLNDPDGEHIINEWTVSRANESVSYKLVNFGGLSVVSSAALASLAVSGPLTPVGSSKVVSSPEPRKKSKAKA